MTTTIHHCDKCGARIETGRVHLETTCGALRLFSRAFDLCPTCAMDFTTWLGASPYGQLPARGLVGQSLASA